MDKGQASTRILLLDRECHEVLIQEESLKEVLNFFDGFRASHELQKIQIWDYEDLKDMVDMDAVAAFRARALDRKSVV